jgi:hypothetical protein
LTAYKELLLLLRATSESEGFVWPGKGLFKTGYKKEVYYYYYYLLNWELSRYSRIALIGGFNEWIVLMNLCTCGKRGLYIDLSTAVRQH